MPEENDEYASEFLSIPSTAIQDDVSHTLNLVPADFPYVERLLLRERTTRL